MFIRVISPWTCFSGKDCATGIVEQADFVEGFEESKEGDRCLVGSSRCKG